VSDSRHLADGELLPAHDGYLLVEEGRLALVSLGAALDLVLAELGPGDALGPLGTAGDGAGQIRVRAQGEVRVLALGRAELESRLGETAAVAQVVLAGLAQTTTRLSTELARRSGGGLRYIYVVPRDQPELFEQLQKEFGSDPQVRIVMDRREGERRQAEESPDRLGPGRRTDPAWSVYLSQPFKPGRGRFIPIPRKKQE
jgi:CRP-like cAMP-binding protein